MLIITKLFTLPKTSTISTAATSTTASGVLVVGSEVVMSWKVIPWNGIPVSNTNMVRLELFWSRVHVVNRIPFVFSNRSIVYHWP